MSDVLIRDVPADDLDRIRSAAAEQGVSMQQYLRETVRAQARYLRRHESLAQLAGRLRGGVEVPDQERQSVLDAIEAADDDRASDLGNRADP